MRTSTASTATPTERLFGAVAAHGPAATALVTRAHAVAAEAHHGRFRKSGDPYISHPVAVAAVVAELGGDVAGTRSTASPTPDPVTVCSCAGEGVRR